MGHPNKSKTFILTSCLVAVSFAIINCQKAPNRNGVKPTVAAPDAKKTEEKGVLECTPESKKLVEAMRSVKDQASVSSKDKTQAEKDNLIEKRKTFITNAEALVKELDKVPQKACLFDKNLKAAEGSTEAKNNNISLTEVKGFIEKAKALQAEDNGEKVAAPTTQKTDEQRRLEREETARLANQKRAEEFRAAKMQLVSDDVKDLADVNSKEKFKKFLFKGEIKSERALELANTNKEIICSISGEKVDKSVSKSLIMGFSSEYLEAKADVVLDGFKGNAMSVILTRVKDNSEIGMMDGSTFNLSMLTLTCLNMKHTEVNVEKLKEAIGYSANGKHIKEIKQAEVTRMETENKAAFDRKKNQPAGGGQTAAGSAPAGQAAAKPDAAAGGASVQISAEEKGRLITAVQTAQKDLDAKVQAVKDLEGKIATAVTETTTAKTALSSLKLESTEMTELAKRLLESEDAVNKAEGVLAEAKKNSAEKKKIADAQKEVDRLKKDQEKLRRDAKVTVKAAGTDDPVSSFLNMQIRLKKAVEAQSKLEADLPAAKKLVDSSRTTLEGASKAALLKGIKQEELVAPKPVAAS